MKSIILNRRIGYIFTLIIILSFLVFALSAILTRGASLPQVLFYNYAGHSFDLFGDYLNSISYVAGGKPYEIGVNYPPFIEVFFFIISKITLVKVEYGYQINVLWSTVCSYVTFYGIIIGIMFTAKKYFHGTMHRGFVIFFCVLISTPTLYAMVRGNVILIAFLFALLFLFNYESPSPMVRELSYVCLAISAAIKLYPALFGLVLFRERRYKDAGRCIVYGLILFILPFFAFGGLSQIRVFFDNIFSLSSEFTSKYGPANKIDLDAIMLTLNRVFGLPLINSVVLKIIIATILVCASFLLSSKWKSITALSMLMILMPGFSFVYTGVFLLIPWLIMLKQEEMYSNSDVIYGVLFSLMFSPLPLGIVLRNEEYCLTGNTVMQQFVLIILCFLMTIDVIKTVHSIIDRKNAAE